MDWKPPTSNVNELKGRLLRRPFLLSCIAFSIYGLLALAANWPSWPGNPSDFRQGDLSFIPWALEWIPKAIGQHMNPFFTDYLNYPIGMNLAQNTNLPFLALVLSPVTLLFGPLSAFNLLLWLAFPASAFSAYWVARRFCRGVVGPFLGGLLYGFSPYMTGQGNQHMVLVFAAVPPLIFYAGYRVFVRQHGKAWIAGLLLGGLLVVQYYISPEVAATSIVMTAVAVLLLALGRPRQVPAKASYAAKALLVGAALTVACTAYPSWFGLKGPQSAIGALGSGISADLLGPVIPTTMERVGTTAIENYADRFVLNDWPENGSYLSIPLIILALLAIAARWRDRWTRFLGAAALAAFVFSLGPYLNANGRFIGWPLPAWILWELPGLKDIGESRMALYVTFFLALLFARSYEAFADDLAMRRRANLRNRLPRGTALRLTAVASLAVASVVMLLPRWPYGIGPSGAPSYFSSSAIRAIPSGSVVLVSPYPSVAEVAPEFWQAISELRFKMIGGYALFRSSDGGRMTPYPAVLQPQDVSGFLWQEATAAGPFPPQTLPTSATVLARDLRRYLRKYHVEAVISTPAVSYYEAIDQYFTNALGKPTYRDGELHVWNHVQRILAAQGPGRPPVR